MHRRWEGDDVGRPQRALRRSLQHIRQAQGRTSPHKHTTSSRPFYAFSTPPPPATQTADRSPLTKTGVTKTAATPDSHQQRENIASPSTFSSSRRHPMMGTPLTPDSLSGGGGGGGGGALLTTAGLHSPMTPRLHSNSNANTAAVEGASFPSASTPNSPAAQGRLGFTYTSRLRHSMRRDGASTSVSLSGRPPAKRRSKLLSSLDRQANLSVARSLMREADELSVEASGGSSETQVRVSSRVSVDTRSRV